MRIDPFLCVIMNDRPFLRSGRGSSRRAVAGTAKGAAGLARCLRGDLIQSRLAGTRFVPSAGSVTVRFIGVEPGVGPATAGSLLAPAARR